MDNQLTYFITLDSLSQLPEAAVAVCAHDAGAASHMTAWLAPFQSKLKLCLAGPAEQLFSERLGIATGSFLTLEGALAGARVLISGTGWATDLEHRARRLAHERGIPSVAVLDHWLNYRERFWRAGEEQLPDQLWVADEDASALARDEFPGLPVLQLPNYWLDELCRAVVMTRPRPPRRPARRLLYLLEPIRVSWSGGGSESGEFQALRYWLQQLPQLIKQCLVANPNQIEMLSLRPHPSDPAGKYDDLIAEFAVHFPIRLDRSANLAEALAWGDAVFGCETQALVAAMACDLPAFSTVPPWAPPCRLPHASLHHLSQLEGV